MDKQYINTIVEEMDKLSCSHPTSVNLDVANTYYYLTKMLRPVLVVEIGCFIGFSSLHIAQALKDQGFGRIISIDTFNTEVDAGNGMENREIVAIRYCKKARLDKELKFIKGFSTEVCDTISNEINSGIDMLFIDGDHSVNGVVDDFNQYYKNVRRGGYVIVHDIYPEMCGSDGPRGLIDILKCHGFIPRHLELLEMPTRDGFGVAVLRKVSDRALYINEIWRFAAKLHNYFIHPLKVKGSKGIVVKVVDKENGFPVPNPHFLCKHRDGENRLGNEYGEIVLEHYLPNRYMVDVEAKGYKSCRNTLLDVVYSGDRVFTIELDADDDETK